MMKLLFYVSVCLYTASSPAMTVSKETVKKLTAQERAALMQLLLTENQEERQPVKVEVADVHSLEDSGETNESSLSQSSSSITGGRRSPRSASSSSSQAKRAPFSFGKKGGQKVVEQPSQEASDKKSPRSARLTFSKGETVEVAKNFLELLEAIKNREVPLSRSKVGQLIQKAAGSSLLSTLCTWARANPHLLCLAGYSDLIQALIESTGYSTKSDAKIRLDVPFFSGILALIETYAIQQLVNAQRSYPETDAAKELSKIIETAISLYPPECEMMLCRRARFALQADTNEHISILVTDLRAILINAHGTMSKRTERMLKGEMLGNLRAIVVKERGLPDEQRILTAFFMIYAGKVEDSLIWNLYSLACAADAQTKIGKKGEYKSLLKKWVATSGNERYITNNSGDIIHGRITGKPSPEDHIAALTAYRLDYTLELPAITTSSMSASSALSKTLQTAADNDDSTFTSNLKTLAAMKKRAKADLMGISANQPERVQEEEDAAPAAVTAPPAAKPLPIRPTHKKGEA